MSQINNYRYLCCLQILQTEDPKKLYMGCTFLRTADTFSADRPLGLVRPGHPGGVLSHVRRSAPRTLQIRPGKEGVHNYGPLNLIVHLQYQVKFALRPF